MKINAIKAYLKKEFIDLTKTKMIYLVYLLPFMIIVLFGYGIRLEVTHARTIIIDQDNTPTSLAITQHFLHTKYFDAKVLHIPPNQALASMKKAKTDIIIIIPPSFEKRLFARQKSEIGVFIDASFPLRGRIMQGYVEGVLLKAMQEMDKQKAHLITLNQRLLFNQALRDENAVLPGLIALALLVAPAILAALLIVKEKELGTIFNFYASPLTKTEFLIAKLTPPFMLHSINIIIAFLLATYLFDVPFRGSFALYLIASLLYVAISVGIGLLVSIVTRTQIAAAVFAMLITIIPSFLYSGMLMPISSMKEGSYIEAHIFPVMYYSQILYDCFLIGDGFGSTRNLLYLGILFLYALTLLLLGSALLKKELR